VIAAVQPPDALAEAHALYLQGLELEVTALDHMLAFYSSFRAEDANRAALAMAEAARRLDQARQAFDRQQAELSVETPLPHCCKVMVVSQQYASCAAHCVSTMRNGWLFVISEHPQLFILLRIKCTDDDKRVGCPFVIL
jgi:hypothetical protein